MQGEINLILEEVMKDYVFKDQYNDAFVSMKENGCVKVLGVDEEDYKLRIAGLYYEKFGKGMSKETFSQIINTVKSEAILKGKRHALFNRIASCDNSIYYDLANNNHEIIKICEKGWEKQKLKEIIFKRNNHNFEQCCPLRGGDINKIFKYINIKRSQRTLFLTTLISSFVSDIQHPIFLLYGEAGCGKSTTAKILKDIVDPSEYDLLTLPESEDDFFLTIDRHWMTVFDNISIIPYKMSDNLCRIISGGARPKRTHYLNTGLTVVKAEKKVIVINGIENVATREDLLSRCILFECKKKKHIKPSEELHAAFKKDKPYILGAIFDVLEKAMKIYKTVDFDNDFRMASFAKFGYAISEALGYGGEEFLAAYRENIEFQNNEAVDSNSFASSLITFANQKISWTGLSSHLFIALKKIAVDQGLEVNSYNWPKASSVLLKKMKAIKSVLRKAGVEFKYLGHSNIGSKILIKKIE